MKVRSKAAFCKGRAALTCMALSLVTGLAAGEAQAQNYPVSPVQRATAQQVAQTGVALSDLAPDAPEAYTVKGGDTLWDLSGLFLRQPWRWPELWGMNLQQVRNPHLIFPGQRLVLEKRDGRATLRIAGEATDARATPTVRLSPRVRAEALPAEALPSLKQQFIEPFLNQAIIVEEGALEQAPRIVAAPEGRVLLARGDRAYVRGPAGAPLALPASGASTDFRVFRSATALRDPVTRAVLGYEAQFLGRATLARGEGQEQVRNADGTVQTLPVPATIDIVFAREESRVGDRLLPEPPRQFQSYVPRAPQVPVEGALVVSIYGSAIAMAGQNQVVVINKGTADGLENGHVLALLSTGRQVTDTTAANAEPMKLPDERHGLLMVFRTFQKLSYALILQAKDGARVGDRVVAPR